MKHIEDMLICMHKYINRIVDVKGNGNSEFHDVSALLCKGEENNTLVFQYLIKELKAHKEGYTRLYKKREQYYVIHYTLIPCVNGPGPENKWMHFLKMAHLIISVHNIVGINVTMYGFS